MNSNIETTTNEMKLKNMKELIHPKNPNLATEWNYDKNNDLTPRDVTPNSHKKVWWKCSEGHEWQAIIKNRNKGRGCSQCTKQHRKKASESKK